MSNRISIPYCVHDGWRWARLSLFGKDHHICAEDLTVVDNKYTFLGQHRVRLYKLKKNVHWRIPEQYDISGVPPAEPPRRQPHRS